MFHSSKISLVLFIFIISLFNIKANWEHKYASIFITSSVTLGDKVYLGRTNGVDEYDKNFTNHKHLTMLNSDLPNNHILDIIKLNENSALIVTMKGFCILENGIFHQNNSMVSSYPEKESRRLYIDKNNFLWTFTKNKVLYYNNKEWISINLSDSVKYRFDIWDIKVLDNEVWVFFNDNTQTDTEFSSTFVNLKLDVAIIKDNQIAEIYNNNDYLPLRQGDMQINQLGDDLIFSTHDADYILKNGQWVVTEIFKYNNYTKRNDVDLIKDANNLFWYNIYDPLTNKSIPMSYDPVTKIATPHLLNEDSLKFYSVYKLGNSIFTTNGEYIYQLENNEWKKYIRKDYVSDPNTYIWFRFINDNYYISVVNDSTIQDYTLISIKDKSQINPIYNGIDYEKLNKYITNKDGEAIYEGIYVYDNRKIQMKNKSLRMFDIVINDDNDVINAIDGNVYFSNLRIDNTLFSNRFATWENDEIKSFSAGYDDNKTTELKKIDANNNKMVALGEFDITKDSVSNFISIYDFKTKNVITFDKFNSDMPGFHYTINGIFYLVHDTSFNDVIIDSKDEVWLMGSGILFNFKMQNSKIYDMIYNNQKVYPQAMEYDANSNEILFKNWNNGLFRFNINTQNFDTLEVQKIGIKGNLTVLKKLLDNNIWAADDLGYLYKYKGNDYFEVVDMKINNRPNLGSNINDISIDVNNYIHLATDIGLLSNNDIIITSIEEQYNYNENRNIISIFPNPSSDKISLNLGGVSIADLIIYDILGNEIMSIPNYSNKSEIDISNLSIGTYTIQIQTSTGSINKRFVRY